jgi:hypothetical protein
MITFECPECGEEMDIGDTMAGKEVRCVGCKEWVDVPERSRKRRSGRRAAARDPGLSGQELALFALGFVLIPGVNVVASSVLYYVWKADKPKRASQINLLGFAVFGFHVVIWILWKVLFAK